MSEATSAAAEDKDAGASPAQEIEPQDFRKLYEDSERSRIAAEERERQARADADAARGTQASEAEGRYRAQLDSIKSAALAKDTEAAAIQAEIDRLIEGGEPKGVGALYRKLAAAEAKLTQLRDTEQYLTENKDTLLASAHPRQQQQQQPGQYTARERDWISKHPQFNTDPDFRDKVVLAHNRAMRSGIKRDTDEYFAAINAAVTDDPPAKQERAAGAPVTQRRPATPPNGRPGSLSPAEQEAADAFYNSNGWTTRTNPATGKTYTRAELHDRWARNKELMAKRGVA